MTHERYQLFTIVETEAGTEVRRARLTEELQEVVSAELHRQREEFLPAGRELIPYEPGYKPDEELLVIEGYPLPAYLRDVETAPLTLPEVSSAEIEEGRIKSLFGVAAADGRQARAMLFQSFDARQVLERGGLTLLLDRDTFRRLETTGLVVGGKLTALLVGESLYFQSEHLVRRYLPLDDFFREATDEEIEKLLRSPVFAPTAMTDFLPLSDRWVRGKVTSILRRETLKKVPIQKITATGKVYGVEVETRRIDGHRRIVVPREKAALKSLLRLLDDDLLTSQLTDLRYQVSSKRRLKV